MKLFMSFLFIFMWIQRAQAVSTGFVGRGAGSSQGVTTGFFAPVTPAHRSTKENSATETTEANQRSIDERIKESDTPSTTGATPNGAIPNPSYPNVAYPNGAIPNPSYPSSVFPTLAFPTGNTPAASPITK